MKVIITLLLLFVIFTVNGQDERKTNDAIETMVDVLYKLNKTSPINNIKHMNPKAGLKDGLWIEPDRSSIWIVNYNYGVKTGKFYCYNIVTGKKEIEGMYDNGTLTGTIQIYDENGNVISVYRNIRCIKNSLTLSLQTTSGMEENYSLKEQEVVFNYEAEYERYTPEGNTYKAGTGVFNDNKNYDIKDNKGYNQELSILKIYDLKK